jgi:hypothetical protein
VVVKRADALRAQLSDRDLAVLTDVGRVRLLSARQIERLHFRTGSERTQARRSRRSLERLHALGLLHRFDRRVGGVRAGSAGYVYGLTGLGQRVMNLPGPAGGQRTRRPWEPSTPFFSHVLAISEVYVRLREMDRAGLHELVNFDAEPACWRPYLGLGGQGLTLKPDAYYVTAGGAFEDHVFLELDRATESLTVVRRKAQAYVDYWHRGLEQQHHGVFPEVRWLVPTDHRREAIVKTLSELPAENWPLFTVMTELPRPP